jgi:Domain of unknown function (DUF4383)
MIRTLGFIFGFAFLLGGALGLTPGVTKDGMYFGIFMVNAPHNILHIVSGTMFLVASISGEKTARLWFQMFGVAYGAIAAAGFLVGEGMILGLISNNLYDAWGHAGLALAMLLIGFMRRGQGANALRQCPE